MYGTLIDTIVDFDNDAFRNIPSIIVSENLLDDLSDSPYEQRLGESAIEHQKIYDGPQSAIILRPFTYGAAIANSAMACFATRFSDGSQFGVWYGSLDLETSVHETVYHWMKLNKDMTSLPEQEIVAERRVFLVRIAGILIDLRNKHSDFSELIAPSDYTFTNSLGAYLFSHGQSGLLAKSARCEGVNAAIFTQKVLSNVRHCNYLTYHWTPGDDTVRVENPPGVLWFNVQHQ